MSRPFTVEQFHDVFRDYNRVVWPAQWLLVTLASAAVAAAPGPRPWSGVFVSASLGFLWAWIALAHHAAVFSRINPVACGFAAVSAAGAGVLIWQGVVRRRLAFRWVPGLKAAAGVALIAFALMVYPFWSAYAGHPFPTTPTFGLPCPTTIFTIGLLCFALPPTPRSTLIVPLLWCLVGAQAALLLGVEPDFGLVAAGLVSVALLATEGRQPRTRNS